MIGITIGIPANNRTPSGPPPVFRNVESLQTDGVDEKAIGPDAPALDFATGQPFTISAWVRVFDGATTTQLVTKRNPDATKRGYSVGFTRGEPVFSQYHDVSASRYLIKSGVHYVATGSWKHVVWTTDGSGNAPGVNIYVNGTLVTMRTRSDTIWGASTSAAGDTFDVGDFDNNLYFDGGVDELAIFARELSAADVASLYNNHVPDDLSGLPDLVAWYRMGDAPADDAAAGGVLEDVAGGYDLSPINMEAGDIKALTPGAYANLTSLYLDGVNEGAIVAGYSPDIESDETFSLSVWFKSSGSGYHCFISRQQSYGNYRGWAFFLSGGGYLGQLRFEMVHNAATSDYFDVRSTNTYNDGVWHHAALTFDASRRASGVRMTVDGVPETMIVNFDNLSAGTIITPWVDMICGFRGNPSYGVPMMYWGHMDELSLWGIELSQAQIAEIYGAGEPSDLAAHSAEADITAWYRLGESPSDSAESYNGSLVDVRGGYSLRPVNTTHQSIQTVTP